MDRIEITTRNKDGRPLISIRVKSPHATLADLLQAWQPLCNDSSIFKFYAADHHAACAGCHANCCYTAYLIPDLIAFRKMKDYWQIDYQELLNNFFDEFKLKNGLLRLKSNPCIFLNNNMCSIYNIRSLMCRFYLCSSLEGESEQFVYSLAWTGMAALQVFAEQEHLLKPASNSGFSSFDLLFKNLIEEYRSDPNLLFYLKAREYSDIPLAPFYSNLQSIFK